MFGCETFVIVTFFYAAVPNCSVKSLCLVLLYLLGVILSLSGVEEFRAMLLVECQLVRLTIVFNLGYQFLQKSVQHHALKKEHEVDTREDLHDKFCSLLVASLNVTEFQEQGNTDHSWNIDTVQGHFLAHPLLLHLCWNLENRVSRLRRLLVLFKNILEL